MTFRLATSRAGNFRSDRSVSRTIAARFAASLRWPLFAAVVLFASIARGIEPENVVVVINGDSEASRRVAHAYAIARRIPDRNLIRLDGVPDAESITVAEFRDKILAPLFAEIESRGLAPQVEVIAYSADFPTAIDIRQDLAQVPDVPKIVTPVGSINGLTVMYQPVMEGVPGYVSFDANWYCALTTDESLAKAPRGELGPKWNAALASAARNDHAAAADAFVAISRDAEIHVPAELHAAREFAAGGRPNDAIAALRRAIGKGFRDRGWLDDQEVFRELRESASWKELVTELPRDFLGDRPTYPFRSRTHWSAAGLPIGERGDGRRYLLSIVLAVTRGRGTTVEQAIEGLERAAASDGTRPSGPVIYTLTSDVRTKTRQPAFEAAVAALEELGIEGRIVERALPDQVADIAGLTIGAATFDFPASGSSLAPGAIAENLTSFGGVMKADAGQTPLSALLVAGAAGSSGTVTEPYAIQPKFPHPFVHVHYARGLTMVEAFHRSLAAPYQLLIVGDPLCRPWRREPDLRIAEVPAGERGLAFEFAGVDARTARVEMHLDGRLVEQWPAAGRLLLPSDRLAGFRNLTLIAVADDEAGTPVRLERELPSDPQSTPTIALEALPGRPETVVVRSPEGDSIELRSFGEKVAVAEGSEARFAIGAELPDRRPMRLVAVVRRGDREISSETLIIR
ncbi:MAG TPA: hypothetical protein DCQ98_18530 [Planctomycetaceae bacterium]|nr:hypothetical protein [Planctomycetaceae bacterium]HRE99656.1 hypothetical protein [Pirellulaceae bacterium]